nr:FAD-dependent oxidoreductase [Gemmatimonadaceae bacterium]
ARPKIDRAFVTRTVAGLRPFRPAGFRVELEYIRDRAIVHNYGHGGSGLTLAPGTAAFAADLARTTGHRQAAVIGAGAVGLMTARAMQQLGISVTVYGAAVSPATTSNVAGALWGAFSLVDPAWETPETGARIAEVTRLSHQVLSALPAGRYGIRRMPLYLVGESPGLPWEMTLTPELFQAQLLGPGEHPFTTRGALRTSSLMIDPDRFLAAVHDDIVAGGGEVLTRRMLSLDDVLSLRAPLIVNCAGLGARDLFGDASLEPIKGELALLEDQPAMDYAVVSLDEDTYVLPRERAIVVGGSRIRGDWSLHVRETEIDEILDRAQRLWRRDRD